MRLFLAQLFPQVVGSAGRFIQWGTDRMRRVIGTQERLASIVFGRARSAARHGGQLMALVLTTDAVITTSPTSPQNMAITLFMPCRGQTRLKTRLLCRATSLLVIMFFSGGGTARQRRKSGQAALTSPLRKRTY
mmetsp:Transcript_95182/g.132263  ORF Transcript_95182/g.132263 Transcript_95182/m.132263 type:complete len:134 (+) Transcript_95182:705-1106(+)